jgi:Ca-activated chloride channel family protein
MSFGQPLWFIALALLPALVALFFRNESRRAALLRQLVAARLQDRLAGSVSAGKRRWRFGILLLGLACVILSLAQPRLGYSWEESRRKGRDVLIAIDCSRSMLSTDVSPNRLARAKLAAQDLIGLLGGDRVGLIAFAGTAFLQAPLTADHGAVLNALSELDTDIIPRGGTDITAAIKAASDAFGKGESDNRCLILMTDGEDLEEDAIKTAEEQNGTMRIFTVGLGSTDGSLIPLPGSRGDTEFVKDENGEIVKSRLDEERLRKIAETTGGFYVHLLNGPAEMKQIATEGLGKMKEKDIDVKMSRRPIERYQWPLAAGIALIAGAMLIGERKRLARRSAAVTAALAAAAFTLFLPRAAQAKNSGLEAYEREDYSDAEDQFSNQLKRLPESQGLQFDLGAAAYKSGDFGKALEAFAKAVTSSDPPLREAAEYNLGNTLYQRGAAQKDKEPKIKEWKNALQHYDQALNIDPQNKDARYNRDLVQRLIDEQEKEEKQQQQQQQKDKKDKKDDKDQKQDQQQQQQKGKNQRDQQKGSQQDSQQNQSQSQKGGQQDQDQQQQSGNSKPDKGGQGQPQDKKDQGDSPQPQNEGQNGDQKDARNQPKDGKAGEQAKNDPQQGKQGNQQPQGADGKDSQEKKHSGEIKAQGSQPQQDAQQQEAEDAQAAREGKMTETQARELLDSLKGEDEHVQLLKPEQRKNNARSFKDW